MMSSGVISDVNGLIWGKTNPSYLYHVVSPLDLLSPPPIATGDGAPRD